MARSSHRVPRRSKRKTPTRRVHRRPVSAAVPPGPGLDKRPFLPPPQPEVESAHPPVDRQGRPLRPEVAPVASSSVLPCPSFPEPQSSFTTQGRPDAGTPVESLPLAMNPAPRPPEAPGIPVDVTEPAPFSPSVSSGPVPAGALRSRLSSDSPTETAAVSQATAPVPSSATDVPPGRELGDVVSGPLIVLPATTDSVILENGSLSILEVPLPPGAAVGAGEGGSPDQLVEAALTASSTPMTEARPLESIPPAATTSETTGCQDDQEIALLAEASKPRIVVVGCGGGGSNTVDRCLEDGIGGAELCAINTDLAHLLSVRAHRKILLGRRATRGRGAGSRPEVGLTATLETEEELRQFLGGAQMAFVTAGLGGGTGTGSAPTVARIARAQGALTVGVVTLPFRGEGTVRREVAVEGLEQLRRVCDTTIVIENDRLLQISPRAHLSTAFKTADSVLASAMKGITETITRPGLVNLDFADIRTIMRDGGVALVGLGKSDRGTDRASDAGAMALNSPLLGPVDLAQAKGALVHVIGPPTMSVREAQGAAQVVAERVPKEARILWGCTIERTRPREDPPVQVLVIVTGVRATELLHHPHATPTQPSHPTPTEVRPAVAPRLPTPPLPAEAPPPSQKSLAQRMRHILRRKGAGR